MAIEVKKTYLLGDFSVEPDRRELTRAGERRHLASRPFQVLLYLIENRDRLVARAELLDRFWEGKDVYDETLTKCLGAIRKALDDRLDSPRYIETRYAEGYRYIGPFGENGFESSSVLIESERRRDVRIVVEEEIIQETAQTNEPAQSVQAHAAPLSLSAPQHSFRTMTLALALIATVLTVSALIAYRSRARSTVKAAATTPAPLPINSIAVMPLKNLSGDPAQEYFSDGLTESFITELSKIKGLKVISRSSVFTFKGKEVDPREVGQRLGVATVLEGSVRKSGDNVRVEVRLVSAQDGRVLWASDSYDRALKDIFTTQDEIACSVTEQLRVRLCGEGEPFKRYTNNVQAYQAYLKGRYFINNQYADLGMAGPEKTLKKAAGYFEQAIQIDPKYAPAYAGLADAYTQVVWFLSEDPKPVIEQAKAAALKAIELDSSMAETHTALASAYLLEWNFEASAREYEQAIALNPGYADAHHQYATYFMAVGRVDSMLAEIKRAEELDPFNLYIIADRGASFYLARRYDEAIAQFRKWHDISQSYNPDDNIGMCYLGKGMFEEAANELQGVVAARGRTPETVTWLAVAYARAGQTKEAEQLLDEVKEMSKKQYVPKTFFAYVYAALGQRDQAFAMLDNAYRERDSTLLGIKTHPWLDPLRSDPRFTSLLNRVGLPQ